MKRRFPLPVSSILLALPILTPFDAVETPVVAVAAGPTVPQPPTPVGDEEIEFELVAPGEFDLAPDDESANAPDVPNVPDVPGVLNASDVPQSPPSDASPAPDGPAIPFATESNDAPNAESNGRSNDASNGAPPVWEAQTLDAAEMERLSQDPLFREFSAAFDEAAPLPTLPNLETFNALQNAETILQNGDARPQSQLILPQTPRLTPEAAAKIAESTAALDEILSIADVDLAALAPSPEQQEVLARLDAEIARLYPLWLDAELNRNVVGRRERVWERAETPVLPNPPAPSISPDLSAPSASPKAPGRPFFARSNADERAAASFTGVRFETANPPAVAAASDWALAPATPFFFEVVDSATGDVFYTKAGDFEPFEGGAALIRGDRILIATVEPGLGVSTGRAERVRILKNGQIQGVDASGKRVVDFNLGTFTLYIFNNPARLASSDGVFFVPTAESGKARPAKLPPTATTGVESGRLLLSNGRPDEIFARIVVLCKVKKRLVEILTQPRLVVPESPTR